MAYFTTGKVFLVPSFDLEEKERRKIDRFLLFLEESGVGEIISKYVRCTSGKGGRPNCNYHRLFATILFGFAFDRYTLREIESACRFDLRYIFLMEQRQVDHSTISRFINRVIVPNEQAIFSLLGRQIRKELDIGFEDAFIDGAKYQANCNKYKFVWKPTAFHRRISAKAYGLISRYGLSASRPSEELIRSSTIASAISALHGRQGKLGDAEYGSVLKALSSRLDKVLEYERKEETCGSGRNSYYKSDRDATARCLKEDYYSGLGSNMHAAYNVQALVIRGFVFAYHVSQSRTDYDGFIPVLDAFYRNYREFHERVCADAGYGILKNYRYLKEHGIGNFVKTRHGRGTSPEEARTGIP